MSYRAGEDACERRKIFCSYPESNHDSSVFQSVVYLLHRLRYSNYIFLHTAWIIRFTFTQIYYCVMLLVISTCSSHNRVVRALPQQYIHHGRNDRQDSDLRSSPGHFDTRCLIYVVCTANLINSDIP